MTDKDLVRQILERDVMNIYKMLPSLSNKLGFNITPFLGIFEDKILGYADLGIDTVIGLLFGTEDSCDIDEAAEIAKMFTTDKIEDYRKRLHKMKKEQISETEDTDLVNE